MVKNRPVALMAGILVAGLGASLGLSSMSLASAAPAPAVKTRGEAQRATAPDELPNPLEDKRRELREQALTSVLNGTARAEKRGPSTVVKVSSTREPRALRSNGKLAAAAPAEDQYVELSREKTDRVFAVLTEFGNQRDPRFPDKDLEPSTPGPTRFDGPLRNQIPEPAAGDNSTVWQPDYNREYFNDLYFGKGDAPGSGGETESVREYFERQSSGRYSINGTVTDWVKVPFNEARYGRSSDDPTTNGDDPNVCSGNVCPNSRDLVRDAVNQWYADQLAAGRSKADVVAELKTFDVWDRYDVDGDGDFNEPDGYLDHFQIVHAGGDEADGDPIQGEDAIWSHRWYVYGENVGTTGPEGARLGGTQIGDTGLWVGDYTMQPENGGQSVFTHEYGHDVGVPDVYDTSGPPPGSENGVNWWSLMGQSRVKAPGDRGIGTRSADLGAWEKLQLGWLDYEVLLPQDNRRIELGPHEYNSAKAQAAVVVLPKKPVTTQLAAPYAGQKTWWSGTGDDYQATMSRGGTVPAGATLRFQANLNIEADYDYAYVEVNDGSGWVSLPDDTPGDGVGTDPAVNNGITGDSAGKWVPLSFDLRSLSGKPVQMRVRYTTDGGVQGNDPGLPPGIFLDAITVTAGGRTVFSDGAETSPNGWTLDGFSSVGSSVTNLYDNYYVASNRTYTSFDAYLRTGPYNFGFTNPDKVELFPYQNGLLVNYWDTSQSDNNTSVHPGSGLILPVDANPRPINRLDGELWRPRVAGYDATFGLEKADSLRLNVADRPSYIRGQAAVPVFRDDRKYWYASQPTAGVKLPNTGTTIRVLSQEGTSMAIRVSKRAAAP